MIQRDLVWLNHTKYLVFGEDGLMSCNEIYTTIMLRFKFGFIFQNY